MEIKMCAVYRSIDLSNFTENIFTLYKVKMINLYQTELFFSQLFKSVIGTKAHAYFRQFVFCCRAGNFWQDSVSCQIKGL